VTAWAAKRFWTMSVAEPCDGGFAVRLDQRTAATPAKTPLILPTLPLAQAIAAEWQVQATKVDPATMPLTRMANSALDKVAPQFAEVADLIAAYGASDLVCYRATGPRKLIDRQAAAWDPILDWSARSLAAPMIATHGVIHTAQPPQSIARLTARTHAFTAFELAAVHDLVAISGSLIIALAVADRHLPPESAWEVARIDETWQAELWGHDDLATRAETHRRIAFLDAGRFFQLCRSQSA
jgi:chaperone required for assembly of F1-ATPase